MDRLVRRTNDVLVTLALWVCFVGAFAGGFWLLFILLWLVRGQHGLQRANRRYLRGFFWLLDALAPGVSIDVSERARLERLSGGVVVCNHLSYLDPILLVSLLPRVTTIVRRDLFSWPVFGWLMRASGYFVPSIESDPEGWLSRIRGQLQAGASLLIFPEGTRSRDGQLGPFRKGAFYIAQQLGVPIDVVEVSGTGRLFSPGRVLLQTGFPNRLQVRILGRVEPAELQAATSLDEIQGRVRRFYESSAERARTAASLDAARDDRGVRD